MCVTKVRIILSLLTIACLIDKAITELCQNCDWLERATISAQVLSNVNQKVFLPRAMPGCATPTLIIIPTQYPMPNAQCPI
ncbi:MAG: hypothetical protein V7L04_21420 [Nostoc sp.]|uniref:hypothetical protein n=1 Tax=Nostoc sp. TaxID=1180 RepID=UPI002FFC6E47